ncbi:hypothetical protein ACPB9E_17400 [Streptomyces exfoliatus]|uniref:hypothetical protein n=1 Tax=Streptomyces exfoliatus TaxID=1905 RepID=UPI003C2B66E9
MAPPAPPTKTTPGPASPHLAAPSRTTSAPVPLAPSAPPLPDLQRTPAAPRPRSAGLSPTPPPVGVPAPAPSPVPVVALPDLPRATTPPVQRRAVLPLASTRSLAPSQPGADNTSAPARTSSAPSAAPLFTPAPAVQRSSAGPAADGTAAPPGSPRPVVPLAPPSAARPVTRPVVVKRQSAPEAVPTPTAPVTPVVTPAPLQRATASTAPAPRATTVTRTAPAPASVQRTAKPASTGPAADDAESPSHLDELARRLVTPLSRLLRAELRADRERVGRLRDHGR